LGAFAFGLVTGATVFAAGFGLTGAGFATGAAAFFSTGFGVSTTGAFVFFAGFGLTATGFATGVAAFFSTGFGASIMGAFAFSVGFRLMGAGFATGAGTFTTGFGVLATGRAFSIGFGFATGVTIFLAGFGLTLGLEAGLVTFTSCFSVSTTGTLTLGLAGDGFAFVTGVVTFATGPGFGVSTTATFGFDFQTGTFKPSALAVLSASRIPLKVNLTS